MIQILLYFFAVIRHQDLIINREQISQEQKMISFLITGHPRAHKNEVIFVLFHYIFSATIFTGTSHV